MYYQKFKCLNDNNLYPDNVSGFSIDFSTGTALASLNNDRRYYDRGLTSTCRFFKSLRYY